LRDNKRLACAYETVTSNIFASDHRLEKKAVFGILCDAQIRHAWCYEICRKFDIYRDAVSSFFLENDIFNVGERRMCGEFLEA